MQNTQLQYLCNLKHIDKSSWPENTFRQKVFIYPFRDLITGDQKERKEPAREVKLSVNQSMLQQTF